MFIFFTCGLSALCLELFLRVRNQQTLKSLFFENLRIGIALNVILLVCVVPFFMWHELELSGTLLDRFVGIIELIQLSSRIPIQYLFTLALMLFAIKLCKSPTSPQTMNRFDYLGTLLPIGTFLVLGIFLNIFSQHNFSGKYVAMLTAMSRMTTANLGLTIPLAAALYLSKISKRGYWLGITSGIIAGIIYIFSP